MNKCALVLIDIQNFYFEEGSLKLYKPEEAAKNAKNLIDYFRENNLDIIHVKHFMGKMSGYSKSTKELVQINDLVSPSSDEKVVTKVQPNSFYKTDLDKILKENEIKTVVLAGMMSNVCVESTARYASELGYKVIVADDACTTKGVSYNGKDFDAVTIHEACMAILNDTFAKVTTSKKIIDEFIGEVNGN